MDFGKALEQLKAGMRVCRVGWNGIGMWIEHIPAKGVDLAYLRLSYPVHSKGYPQGARVAWAPSQTDVLAEDWEVIGEGMSYVAPPRSAPAPCVHRWVLDKRIKLNVCEVCGCGMNSQ